VLFWTLLLVTLSTTTTKILINHFSLSLLLTDGVSSFSSFRPLLHTPFRHKQASFPPPQSFPLITRIFFQYFSSKTQQQQTSNHTIHPNISWVCIFFPLIVSIHGVHGNASHECPDCKHAKSDTRK
jgi:hypothetical protein